MADEGDALDGHLFGADQPCFGCGPQHPLGFRLTFERDGSDVVTQFTPGPLHQGPPGIMHGGLVSTLADEIGAWAVIAATERFGFTTSVSGRLRKAIRVGVPVVGRGRVTSASSRVVDVAVEISQRGDLAFEGAFRFVLLDRVGVEALLQAPIPAAWERFCR